MIYVYSTRKGRKSFAGKLSRLLGTRVRHGPFKRASLICWGRSEIPEAKGPIHWLNHHPNVVAAVSNKLRCFQELTQADIRTVDWTTDIQHATDWLLGGSSVYERHVLNGHSGAGIVLKNKKHDEELAPAPLYTRQVHGKFDEYRVHVVAGEVICVQQKRKMTGEKIAELGLVLPEKRIRHRIRTYGNGWAFAVHDIVPLSEDNQKLAISAMHAVNAGSGCVDMAVTEDGIGYVIEINSAPALRSDTVANAYADKFAAIIGQQEVRRG